MIGSLPASYPRRDGTGPYSQLRPRWDAPMTVTPGT